MNHFDTIIIGGGLGGLTAGAKLAKERQKVLLLEQHSIPGGCATTFKRKDFTMEVGLHETDGFDDLSPKRKIFEELGIFKTVDFVRVPEFYRFKKGNIDIVIPDNVEEAIKVLTKHFPQEEKGIQKFFSVITSIRKEVYVFALHREKWKFFLQLPFFPFLYPHVVRYHSQNLGDFLDSLTRNEDLKLILTANLQYYHDDPYTMSLLYFSTAQAGFYAGGGYYIKGGSQCLSNALSKIITDNGGEVFLGKKVTKILTKNGVSVGVEYQKTFGGKNEKEEAFANTLIANAAIPQVIHLLPEENRNILQKKTKNLQKSCSILTLYIGFKKEVKMLGNKYYSTFLFPEEIRSLKDFAKNATEDFTKRGFVFVDYSQIDSGLAPEGKSFGAICMVDSIKNWEEVSKDEYKAKKEAVTKILLERLEALIPGITEEIEYMELGTPKTVERYTLNPEGSIYGFSQTPQQAGIFRIPNKSPIKNLFFASAWANPGGGFTGAILSGWFCAQEILRK